MAEEREPAIISALKEKAPLVRQIAEQFAFTYIEEEVADERGIVRFTFDLTRSDIQKLTDTLPIEVYAYRAIIGGFK